MDPATQQSAERQHKTAQSEGLETESPGGKMMAAPAFQLMAAGSVVQRATPGAGYERGNRPDPNNSVGGAEIRSSEGRIANVGDRVTFTIHGVSNPRSVSWRSINDLTYAPNARVGAVSQSPATGLSMSGSASIQGVHTIVATVTPASGAAFELRYQLNVEPASRNYATLAANVTPSPLATMDDFIALVERIERAYSSLAWQDVVTKIRAEQYPGRGGEGSGIMRAFTWDDLIDEQDEVAPLQSSIASPADIAALRRSQTVTYRGQRIDIGHVLTGVDSMNFPETAGIFSNNRMSGPAAATWSGDVGSALTNWATNHPANDHSDAGKQRFYDNYSSMDDLLGDMDGINLGGLPALPRTAKLSQRLRTYYNSNPANGVNKRYTNFCSVSGFDVQNGRLTSAARTYIRTQVLNFARGYNIRGSMADGMILSGGGYGGYVSPQTMAITSGARIQDNVDWFANRFIQQLETGLASE